MNNLKRIYRLYRDMLLFNLAMLAVIAAVFPEPFSLLRDPVSWLGKMGPGNGFAFYLSFWLFTGALLFNIYRWNQIVALLSRNAEWGNFAVRIAFRAVLVGFILMLCPCDRSDPIHSTGGVLIGVGLWLISTMMLIRMNKMNAPFYRWLMHIILHSGALFCIYNFVLNTSWKGFSQRPAILAIVLVTTVYLHLQIRDQQKTGY